MKTKTMFSYLKSTQIWLIANVEQPKKRDKFIGVNVPSINKPSFESS